jgi:DnaK suppressor protein
VRKRTLEKFRRLLMEKRRELTENYREDLKRSRNVKGDGAEDYADYAFSSYTKEFLLSLSGMERAELLQVEEALKRTHTGDYGICLECGEKIGDKRLTAVPWADYCISCKELEEQGLLPSALSGNGDEAEEA